MPKKINIDIDFSCDNTLLAISCHKKDYWMAYNLNEALKVSFRRIDDLPYFDQSLDKLLKYSLFHYFDSDCQLSFYLLTNYNPDAKLFRAFKTIDYFILIHGSLSGEGVEKLLSRIKSIKGVLTAYLPDMTSVKDYTLFLSDLELHMVDVLKG